MSTQFGSRITRQPQLQALDRWLTPRRALALFLVGWLADGVGTAVAMSVIGPGMEGNPLLRWLAVEFGNVGTVVDGSAYVLDVGIVAGLVLKTAVVVGLTAGCARLPMRRITGFRTFLTVAGGVGLAIGVWNVAQAVQWAQYQGVNFWGALI